MDLYHSLIEITYSLIIGYAIIFYQNGKLSRYLLLTTVVLNAVHAVLGLNFFGMQKGFIPATWFIVALLQGWFYFEVTFKREKFPLFVLIAIIAFAAIPFFDFSYYTGLPSIGRAWEVVPLVIAIVFLANNDIFFDRYIINSCALHIASLCVMVFSTEIFDAAFFGAHVLKASSAFYIYKFFDAKRKYVQKLRMGE
jgi:hypothetical protein